MTVAVEVTRRIPAGWYPDRNDRSRRQWFDGTDWTEYYSAVPTKPLAIVTPLPIVEIASARRPVRVEDVEMTTTRHSLRGAITFKDRVPAAVLSGLVLTNVVMLGIVLRLI